MADKSKNKNVFQKIAQVYKEVRQELRKSTWPSKEKLKNTSAVVLAAIAIPVSKLFDEPSNAHSIRTNAWSVPF